jgi:hypothetical protein
MSELSEEAKVASAKASPVLLARFGTAALKSALQDLGAHELASISASDLLQRWRAEMATAEIAHGFDTSPNFDDLDLSQAAALQFFPNQWQLEILYPRNVSDPATQRGRYGADGFFGTVSAAAAAETSTLLYHLANFTGPVPFLPGTSSSSPQQPFVPGGWPSNLAEASERMVYGVINSHRLDFPTWKWGNAAVIFNSSAVAPLLTLSPMDTGDFTGACPAFAPKNFSQHFCEAWSSARCDFWFCKPQGEWAPSTTVEPDPYTY